MIINTCEKLFNTNDITKSLEEYFSNPLIADLYFQPKKVNKELIMEKLKNSNYLDKVTNTINKYKNTNIEELISKRIKGFEEDTNYKLDNYKIYVIIGLDTTTIYSLKYNNEDITV